MVHTHRIDRMTILTGHVLGRQLSHGIRCEPLGRSQSLLDNRCKLSLPISKIGLSMDLDLMIV